MRRSRNFLNRKLISRNSTHPLSGNLVQTELLPSIVRFLLSKGLIIRINVKV